MFTEITTVHGTDNVETLHLVNCAAMTTITKDANPRRIAFINRDGHALIGHYPTEEDRNDEFDRLSNALQTHERQLLHQMRQTEQSLDRISEVLERLSENLWHMRTQT